jgi:hypothetical protein
VAVTVAAESRWTTHPTVIVDCPRCGRPLPPVTVDVDTRASGKRMLSLSLTVQELDDAWWTAARQEHERCLPAAVGGKLAAHERPLPGGRAFEVIEG